MNHWSIPGIHVFPKNTKRNENKICCFYAHKRIFLEWLGATLATLSCAIAFYSRRKKIRNFGLCVTLEWVALLWRSIEIRKNSNEFRSRRNSNLKCRFSFFFPSPFSFRKCHKKQVFNVALAELRPDPFRE